MFYPRFLVNDTRIYSTKVRPTTTSRKGLEQLAINSRILRTPMENVDSICSLESRLSFGSIFSVGILNIFEVKMLNPTSRIEWLPDKNAKTTTMAVGTTCPVFYHHRLGLFAVYLTLG